MRRRSLKTVSHSNTIFRILVIVLMASLASTHVPVICVQNNGSMKLEIGCETITDDIDFRADTASRDHPQNCVDLPLWPHSPVFSQAVRVDQNSSRLPVADEAYLPPIRFIPIITYSPPSEENRLILSQPRLAIQATRLLL
ncbi:MAG: hypothetical protein GXO90_08120 [FCB group bacterium]|nr:hypothetical protein [FCB group bacterium]